MPAGIKTGAVSPPQELSTCWSTTTAACSCSYFFFSTS